MLVLELKKEKPTHKQSGKAVIPVYEPPAPSVERVN
jgi:hypothetical protein